MARFSADLLEDFRDLRIVAVIALNRTAFAAGFRYLPRRGVDGALAVTRGTPGDVDGCALLAQRERDALTNTSARAGYHRDLACQVAHTVPLLFL